MLTNLLKGEPVALGGAITATMTVLVAFGVDEKICAAIGAAAVAWLLVARSMVSPLPTVIKAVENAAKESAGATAEALTEETVGASNRITTTGLEIVGRTSSLAADGALKAIGVSRRAR